MSTTQVTERLGEGGAYIGAVGAVTLWGLSVSEVAVTISALFAGLSFLVHLWASWRRDRREEKQLRILTGHDAGLFAVPDEDDIQLSLDLDEGGDEP